MTINNPDVAGFRWVRGKNGQDCPPVVNVPMATAYAPAVDPGTQNYAVGGLYPGDPIMRLSTGYGALCPGNEDGAATGVVFGIMAAVAESGYWDGSAMVFGTYLPSGQGAYGTNEQRRTYIKVIPAAGQIFDAAVSNDGVASKADMLALLTENCDHRLTLFDTGAAGAKALPKIDFTATPESTAQWRIYDFSKAVELFDYAGTNPRVEVTVVEGIDPEFSAAGV